MFDRNLYATLRLTPHQKGVVSSKIKSYHGANIDFQRLRLELKKRDSPVMEHLGFYDLKVLLDPPK